MANTKEIICEENHLDVERESEIISRIPDETVSVDVAETFAHLSDSTRVRILSMLSETDMCVCEMADILKMSQPAVSHHLRGLRQCGIIRFRKEGKRAVYFLNSNEQGRLIKKLLQVVCQREGE